MLKYVKDHMSSIDGIQIFPIIALLLFFLFFCLMLWFTISARRDKMKMYSKLPFDNTETLSQ